MIAIEVNNRQVEARDGEMLLDVLRREGVHVPTLCHVPGLTPTGACRMCVVEVEGQRNLVPSCAFPVYEGMSVQTHSPRAIRARKTIVELLLADHPDDCLYCVRSGTCQLQSMAMELGVRDRRYSGDRSIKHVDLSSEAILRDPDKCILCGKCVRVCEEVQTVGAIDFINRGSQATVGTAFDQGLNVSSCVYCGQCVTACPTGALREQSSLKEVQEALSDPEMFVVVQHAPSISVTLAEAFGTKAGTDACGVMTSALRRLGFDRVFDTSFAADLTIMEEASELVERIQNGGPLPMMTSCSPGWIKFVEQFYPEFIPNLSTCKSPQQMMGAIIKSYFAEKEGIDPEKIFSVSIMPCTAKKFEANRPEMGRNGVADIDAVLTTRELARMIKMRGLALDQLTPEDADNPLGERSSAGKLFGATGGVMEAAARTAYHMVTGRDLPELKIKPLRGSKGVKEARLDMDGVEVGVAVANGLGNARTILEALKAGRDDLHFIEIMTCPNGCIGGGGQLIGTDIDAVKARMQALYRIDRDEPVRQSHENESVKTLYREYLGRPLGKKSHELLHTHYAERSVIA
ncbi:MAG: NADH-dependent [FeFe] hydrogenase, group A6 [Pseudomonadales bacterium]|nr:NADH-dependent [FeFe] hydrogenase, group A6 [Pseudomonadales bacterium]